LGQPPFLLGPNLIHIDRLFAIQFTSWLLKPHSRRFSTSPFEIASLNPNKDKVLQVISIGFCFKKGAPHCVVGVFCPPHNQSPRALVYVSLTEETGLFSDNHRPSPKLTNTSPEILLPHFDSKRKDYGPLKPPTAVTLLICLDLAQDIASLDDPFFFHG